METWIWLLLAFFAWLFGLRFVVCAFAWLLASWLVAVLVARLVARLLASLPAPVFSESSATAPDSAQENVQNVRSSSPPRSPDQHRSRSTFQASFDRVQEANKSMRDKQEASAHEHQHLKSQHAEKQRVARKWEMASDEADWPADPPPPRRPRRRVVRVMVEEPMSPPPPAAPRPCKSEGVAEKAPPQAPSVEEPPSAPNTSQQQTPRKARKSADRRRLAKVKRSMREKKEKARPAAKLRAEIDRLCARLSNVHISGPEEEMQVEETPAPTLAPAASSEEMPGCEQTAAPTLIEAPLQHEAMDATPDVVQARDAPADMHMETAPAPTPGPEAPSPAVVPHTPSDPAQVEPQTPAAPRRDVAAIPAEDMGQTQQSAPSFVVPIFAQLTPQATVPDPQPAPTAPKAMRGSNGVTLRFGNTRNNAARQAPQPIAGEGRRRHYPAPTAEEEASPLFGVVPLEIEQAAGNQPTGAALIKKEATDTATKKRPQNDESSASNASPAAQMPAQKKAAVGDEPNQTKAAKTEATAGNGQKMHDPAPEMNEKDAIKKIKKWIASTKSGVHTINYKANYDCKPPYDDMTTEQVQQYAEKQKKMNWQSIWDSFIDMGTLNRMATGASEVLTLLESIEKADGRLAAQAVISGSKLGEAQFELDLKDIVREGVQMARGSQQTSGKMQNLIWPIDELFLYVELL